MTRGRRLDSERRASSAAAIIYRDLRADILSLARPPGEPIGEAEITRAYGVSRTPAREAMLRLADEQLIEIFPQRGTFVAAIPIDELPEAIELRRVIEEAVAREAAVLAQASDIATLRSELDRQRECEAAAAHEAFHAADERFHALLASIAGRKRFWLVVLQNKTQVDRFRRLTLPEAGRMGAVVAEHAAIVDALERGDPDQAADAMTRHLEALLSVIDALRTSHPTMFAGRATKR